jgi:tripeptidyl-peptidase-1
VSAQGDYYRIFVAGNATKVGGTSTSSPTFAAFVALLNDARLRKGKAPLGFLNPLFYLLLADKFNDITEGQSAGCGTPGFNVRI